MIIYLFRFCKKAAEYHLMHKLRLEIQFEEFQLWYGPDLKNCVEDDNSGHTCADVYAWYEWIKAYL